MMFRNVVLLFVLCPLALAASQQKKGEVHEQPGNVIRLDDGFEYQIADYGVGSLQIRPEQGPGPAQSFTPPVFWAIFRITNTSEHFIATPQHFVGVTEPVYIVDNWGNSYQAGEISLNMVGGNYYGVTFPVPTKQGIRYKPGESALELKVVALDQFVSDIHELRVYLNIYAEQYNQLAHKTFYHFFAIHEPMQRHRDLRWNQAEPQATELQMSTGVQDFRP